MTVADAASVGAVASVAGSVLSEGDAAGTMVGRRMRLTRCDLLEMRLR